MDPLIAGLGGAAAVAALAAVVLGAKWRSARAELEALKNRLPAPVPPRLVECRREAFGLLWFPTLTVDDAARTVTAAAAGLPHCAKCVKALTLSSAVPEEWTCEGCGEKRPGRPRTSRWWTGSCAIRSANSFRGTRATAPPPTSPRRRASSFYRTATGI